MLYKKYQCVFWCVFAWYIFLYLLKDKFGKGWIPLHSNWSSEIREASGGWVCLLIDNARYCHDYRPSTRHMNSLSAVTFSRSTNSMVYSCAAYTNSSKLPVINALNCYKYDCNHWLYLPEKHLMLPRLQFLSKDIPCREGVRKTNQLICPCHLASNSFSSSKVLDQGNTYTSAIVQCADGTAVKPLFCYQLHRHFLIFVSCQQSF